MDAKKARTISFNPKRLVVCALLGAGLGFLLQGCGSNKPYEYHLLPVQPAKAVASSLPAEAYTNPDTPCISLGVDRLELPDYLNSDKIAGRLDGSKLFVYDQKRWFEPLQGAMKRAMTLQLIADLPTLRIQEFPWRQDDQPVCRLTVIFFDLVQVGDNDWIAKVQWQLYHPPRRIYFSDTQIDIRLSETDLARELPQAYAYLQAIESTSNIIAAYVKSLPQVEVEIEEASTPKSSAPSS